MNKANKENLPKHIAIIPNGNRTWARQKNLPETEGHKVGVEKLAELARYLRKRGINTATAWGMSTENLKSRNPIEVKGLLKLMAYTLNKWGEEAHGDGARFIHLGRKDRLPKELIALITKWEEKTLNNTTHTINVAFDYGGHDELLRAFKKAHDAINAGEMTFEDLYAEDGKYQNKYPYYAFKKFLDTKDQPYPFPDLIIRASGELRLSGFMPWQTVYSEFYAPELLFPDFTTDTIDEAIEAYQNRDRKFGGDSEDN